MNSSRRNVSKACTSCRQRRCRCDGAEPTCGRCLLKGLECDYTQVRDKRHHNASRKKIEELEARLREAQAELRAFRGGEATVHIARSSTDTGTSSSNKELPVYRAVDSIQRDWHTGNLVFMNPTSIPALPADTTEFQPPRSFDFSGVGNRSGDQTTLPSISIEESEELLQLYFTFLNGFDAFVDEDTFRRDLNLYYQDPNQYHPAYSPCLHMAILSVASHISNRSESTQNQQNAGTKGYAYLQRALDALEAEIETPKPATVTGIILISIGMAELGRANVHWLYSGIAVRLIQALGCHIDSQPMLDQGTLTQEEYTLRSNAFWTAYIQDKLVALYMGRMPALRQGDYDLSHPKPGTASQSALLDLKDLQAAFLSLSNVCADIIKLLYGFKHVTDLNACSVNQIQHKLQTWSSTLSFPARLPQDGGPRQPSPQVIAMHATHNTLSIIFYKSFLRRHCLDSAEGRICFDAALSTVKLAKMFDLTYTITKAPITMSQNLYGSGSVLTLIIADLFDQQDKRSERDQAQKALDELMSLLARLSSSWRCSLQAFAALQAMSHTYAINQIQDEDNLSSAFAEFETGENFDIDSILNFDWTTFDSVIVPHTCSE